MHITITAHTIILHNLYVLQSGFLDKNNDSLHGSLEQLMGTSQDPFLKGLFVINGVSVDPTGSYAKKLVLDSIGSKFRVSNSKAIIFMTCIFVSCIIIMMKIIIINTL